NMVYIMACGTRAALISLMFMAVPLVGGLFIYQPAWQIKHWSRGQKLTALGIFVYALAGFGSLPSGNATPDLNGHTAFQRTFVRTQTLAPTALATEESFSMRRTMWSATLRMIADRPISGVGGGVWEVDQPLYLPEGATLETDYYVHNEFLQHIAEYGLIGWLTICGAVAYLALAAWRTYRDRKREEGVEEGFVRMTALCSLFALFVVSNAGFPWRMATTCALFALGLAVVAASDARMGYRGWLLGVTDLKWSPVIARGVLAALAACLVLAVYISERAAVAEHKIVYATKLSLGVTQSGNPNAPQFQKTREDINRLIREGVAINPHYRKITPMVADNMAGWGDWVNAVWLWESVLGSRPYIMAIMANAAKGNFVLRDYERSSYWVQRMQELRPNSVTARSLQVTLLDHQGKRAEALKLARQSLDEGMVDADLAINTFIMARDLADVDLGIRALEWRNRLVPREASQNHYKAGMLYDQAGREDKALEAFRLSLQAIPAELQQQVRGIIPAKYHSRL
ncbi:MAG: hypothetical protein RL758_2373, partial [Pseudomonadota bacterium]